MKKPKSTPFKPPRMSDAKRLAPDSPEQTRATQRRRAISPASSQQAFEALSKQGSGQTLRLMKKTYHRRNAKKAQQSLDSEDKENDSLGTQSPAGSATSKRTFQMPPDFNDELSQVTSTRTSSSRRPIQDRKSFQNPDFEIDPLSPGKPRTAFEMPEDIEIPIYLGGSSQHASSRLGSSPPESPRERRCPFCRKKLPDSFTESPPKATRAHFGYCQRHETATTLAAGKSKGYPTSIDFTFLKSRVVKTLPEIRKIIERPVESEFMTKLRSKTSRRTAAAPMSMMNFFEDSQPGYYGTRGAEVISQTIMSGCGNDIRGSDARYEDVIYCGGVINFISSVLVPEVGVRLIMNDMDVTRDEAKQIMRDSVSFGTAINGSVEVLEISDELDNESTAEEAEF